MKIMELLDKKTVIILAVVTVLAPVLVNILMFIPSFGLAATTTDNWLGFFGNYSGGIVGGVVAYIITYVQIENEKKVRQEEDKEKEQFIYTIVQNFLFEEIKSNLAKVPFLPLQDAARSKLTGTYVSGGFNFETQVYDEIKFELAKYNNPIVKETIELYRAFKLFGAVKVIDKELDQGLAIFCYERFNHWAIKLGEQYQ